MDFNRNGHTFSEMNAQELKEAYQTRRNLAYNAAKMRNATRYGILEEEIEQIERIADRKRFALS